MMDGFVPSPGMTTSHFAVSPHSSIYEPDRTELSSLCGGIFPFSNPSVDSACTEDLCNLDDNFENSSLNTLLTADVINRLQVPAREMPTTSDYLYGASTSNKPVINLASAECIPTSVGHNPTLTQLNMDVISVEDIFSNDTENSKLSEASFDYTDLNCSPVFQASTPQPLVNLSPYNTPSSAIISSQIKTGFGQTTQSVGNLGTNYVQNFSPNYFPPRQTNPPKIGVVAPVQQPKPTQHTHFIKQEQGPTKPLVQQTPNLLSELLSKKPSSEVVKREFDGQKPQMMSYPLTDAPAQIVPSADVKKRDASGNLKPGAGVTGSLVKAESQEETWRDIESLIQDCSQQPQRMKRRRCDSGSSGHMSNDEDDDEDALSMYGDKYGADDSDDDMSDIDADLTSTRPEEHESLIPVATTLPGGKKQKPVQYFWQYNVQAKGPKGTRLKLAVDRPADPHVLKDFEFEDPVFDECNTTIAGIRHGGKARKGDGNEISPNPRKLYLIGLQLARLNKKINACCVQINSSGPESLSAAQKNESRKEKNKLASRACRLKKKANHEANKIKLYGLSQEHSQLNSVSTSVWEQLREKAKAILASSATPSSSATSASASEQTSLSGVCVPLIDSALNAPNMKVAGHSTDYVNSVILKVEAGESDGGLIINRRKSYHKS